MELGDKAKIVKYGHLIFFSKEPRHAEQVERFAKSFPIYKEGEDFYYFDIRPELVNEEVKIVNKVTSGGVSKYAVEFNTGNRISWLHGDQLEKIWKSWNENLEKD
jgi:hypothetical protein